MIEDIIIKHLTDAKLRAYGEDPRDEVAYPYYVVTRTGGGEDEHLRRATLAVQSYGATMYDAALASDAMVSLLLGARTLDSVSSIYLVGEYNFTDRSTKKYRYQAVFEITYYKEA